MCHALRAAREEHLPQLHRTQRQAAELHARQEPERGLRLPRPLAHAQHLRAQVQRARVRALAALHLREQRVEGDAGFLRQVSLDRARDSADRGGGFLGVSLARGGLDVHPRGVVGLHAHRVPERRPRHGRVRFLLGARPALGAEHRGRPLVLALRRLTHRGNSVVPVPLARRLAV